MSNSKDSPEFRRISPYDEESMALLLRRVSSAVRKSCPPYLANQAEDIAQNVLLQLLKKIKKNEGNPTFSSMYLLKAAHGATVDEIRRRSRRKEQMGLGETMMEEKRERRIRNRNPWEERSVVKFGIAWRESVRIEDLP